LDENNPIQQRYYLVKAVDQDRGEENGRVGYELVSTEPVGCPVQVDQLMQLKPTNAFQIHPSTGELTLVAPLDYESHPRYTLVIRARDSGVPPRHSTATIHLNVLDVNDHAPHFPQSLYRVEVAEDAPLMSRLATIQANDADSGENGYVQYRLESKFGDEEAELTELFAIEPTSGELFLRGQLDRERRGEYALIVVASDNGVPQRLESNMSVHVRVVDVNDNTPQCRDSGNTTTPTQMNFNLSLTTSSTASNNQPNHLIGVVRAVDYDEGENSSLIYTLQTPHEYFDLKPKGDLLLRKRIPLTRSSAKKPVSTNYRLPVIVEDQGRPYRRSTVCQVVVRVEMPVASGAGGEKPVVESVIEHGNSTSNGYPTPLKTTAIGAGAGGGGNPIRIEVGIKSGGELWRSGDVVFGGFSPPTSSKPRNHQEHGWFIIIYKTQSSPNIPLLPSLTSPMYQSHLFSILSNSHPLGFCPVGNTTKLQSHLLLRSLNLPIQPLLCPHQCSSVVASNHPINVPPLPLHTFLPPKQWGWRRASVTY